MAAIALPDSKSATAKPFDQLPVAHRNRARLNEFRVPTCRYVVMIKIEAALRQSATRGELMQFIERGITDQMRPERTVRRPHRLVNQHGHASESRAEPGLTECGRIR